MRIIESGTGGDGDAIGVILVSYCSSDVIAECLASLAASEGARLHVVICENASPDASADVIREWAVANGVAIGESDAGEAAPAEGGLPWLTLLRAPRNLGFAGGVNAGLAWLAPRPEIGLFWLLNPDCVVEPGTAAAYAACAAGRRFGLMGGRTRYLAPPGYVQSDGGRVRRWTGICENVNFARLPEDAPMPEGSCLDYLSGANLVASRAFVETVGPMREDYFLYYEEVDWAYRRGALTILTCPGAVVGHHGGTAIGTGSTERRASGFANYFNYRNRMRFVARFHWPRLPVAYLYSLAKLTAIALSGGRREALGAFRGLHQLAPPREVAARIAPEAADLAFGRRHRSP